MACATKGVASPTPRRSFGRTWAAFLQQSCDCLFISGLSRSGPPPRKRTEGEHASASASANDLSAASHRATGAGHSESLEAGSKPQAAEATVVGYQEAWRAFLSENAEKLRPGTRETLQDGFAWVPEDLRLGAWSWWPTLLYGAVVVLVLGTAPAAAATFEALPAAGSLRIWRLAGALFGFAVLCHTWRTVGFWPMTTWTILGWTLMTLRMFAGACLLTGIQRVLTFPSLVSNTVTVLLWYLAIVPGLLAVTEPQERRKVAHKVICSVFLFLVHGLNLPLSIVDWAVEPARLELFDLWAGMAYSLLYLTFYLLVLDPLGVHFYFILSPRKWWGALVYAGVFLLEVSIFALYNLLESSGRGTAGQGTGLATLFSPR